MAQKSIMQLLDEMAGKGKSHVREPLTLRDKQEVLYRQKGKCKRYKFCKVDFYKKGVRIHYDHIKPVKEGGKKGKKLSNIQALCPNCHDWKTHMEDKSPKGPKRPKDQFGINIKIPKIKMSRI